MNNEEKQLQSNIVFLNKLISFMEKQLLDPKTSSEQKEFCELHLETIRDMKKAFIKDHLTPDEEKEQLN